MRREEFWLRYARSLRKNDGQYSLQYILVLSRRCFMRWSVGASAVENPPLAGISVERCLPGADSLHVAWLFAACFVQMRSLLGARSQPAPCKCVAWPCRAGKKSPCLRGFCGGSRKQGDRFAKRPPRLFGTRCPRGAASCVAYVADGMFIGSASGPSGLSSSGRR